LNASKAWILQLHFYLVVLHNLQVREQRYGIFILKDKHGKLRILLQNFGNGFIGFYLDTPN
jgi:hypothetical protein